MLIDRINEKPYLSEKFFIKVAKYTTLMNKPTNPISKKQTALEKCPLPVPV
jgi:hypothetical protein